MPTYEYKCENCDYKFEKMQSIAASALRKCPKCGKLSLKRLIGIGAGIIFKGSGFYQTDYRNDSYKQASKKETDKNTKKEEKTEAKTETKAETKTVTKTEAAKTPAANTDNAKSNKKTK